MINICDCQSTCTSYFLLLHLEFNKLLCCATSWTFHEWDSNRNSCGLYAPSYDGTYDCYTLG